MNTDPIYVTFEFDGNLGEEVNRVKLGIKGLGDESAKTYMTLIESSDKAFHVMSENNRELAVSIQSDILYLRQLSAVQASVNEAFKNGEISTGEYVGTKARLAAQESELKQGIKDNMILLNESIEQDRQVVGSIEAKREALDRLEKAYRKLSEVDRNGREGEQLLSEIKGLKSELSSLDDAYSAATGGGKNFVSTITALPGPIGKTASAIKSMTKAALAFIATPLGVVLAAIAAALAAVTSWFRRTEEGQNALAVASAAFSAILNSLLDVVDKVGEWLYKAFTNPKEALIELSDFIKGQFMNRLEAIGGMGAALVKIFSGDLKEGFADYGKSLFDFTTGVKDASQQVANFYDNVNDRVKQSTALAERRNALDVTERNALKEKAELQLRLNELRNKAYDMSVPEKERVKYLKEALALSDRINDKDIAIAKEKYEIQKAQNALGTSLSKEDKQAEAEAYSAWREAEAKKYSARNMMQRQMNGLSGKMQKEESKSAIDTLKKELDIKKQAYLLYYQQIEHLGKEAADKAYASLISGGNSYREYVQKQIDNLEKKEDRTQNENDTLSFLYIEKDKIEGKKTPADLLKEEIEKLKKLYGDDLSKLKAELLKLQEMNAGDQSEIGVQKNNIINDALKGVDVDADAHFKNLLKTYQTSFQKLTTLEENYRKDVELLRSRISESSSEEEISRINDAVKARTEAYGKAIMQESDMFTRLFGDLSKESTKALSKLLSDAMSADLSGLSPKDVKVFQEAVRKLEAELRERNPFKIMSADFNKLVADIRSGLDITSSLEGFSQSFAGAKNYVGELGESLGQVFGDDVNYAIDQAMELGQAVFDVGSGIAKFASGDILGGVASVVKGLGSIFSMGNKVKEMNRRAREEQQKFYDEAIAGEREYTRLLRERLRTQQEIGETTLAYNQRISAELKKQQAASQSEYNRLLRELQGEEYVSGVGYKHGTWLRKAKTWNEYSSLAGKSYEDIEKLYTEGKLEDKVSKLFEQLRALKEEGTDINQMLADQEESMREVMTGTTSESIADAILKGFAEGKRNAADFADDFEEMLNNAVLQGVKMKALEEPLRQWYESFAEASGSGLTEDKIASLKEQYDKIIADAARQLEDAEKITGMSMDGSSRSAAAKGIAAMSQDSANELNGNFNALLIYEKSTAEGVANINTTLIQGLSTLKNIEQHTSHLEGIKKDIGVVKTGIQEMVNKGLILRKQ